MKVALRNEAEAEAELARLNHILATTPPDQKRLLGDTREAIRDLEYRLKEYRKSEAASLPAVLKRKESELAAARAELVRLEKLGTTDKVLLGNARSKIREVETALQSLREPGRSGGMTLRA
jgi:chromosome segregation ATPase